MLLVSLAPVLTPHGRLIVERDEDAPALDAELAQRMEGAFTRGSGHGLLALGADEIGVALPPAFSFWREFAALYLTGVCTRPIDVAEPHRAKAAWLVWEPTGAGGKSLLYRPWP